MGGGVFYEAAAFPSAVFPGHLDLPPLEGRLRAGQELARETQTKRLGKPWVLASQPRTGAERT